MIGSTRRRTMALIGTLVLAFIFDAPIALALEETPPHHPEESSQQTEHKEEMIEALRAHLEHLLNWPAAPAAPLPQNPLAFDGYAGPYQNEAGRAIVDQINQWYREGTAAGLTQDTFRSFDNGHSGVRKGYCPQLEVLEPVPAYIPPRPRLFDERVTFGVQSYGARGNKLVGGTACVIEVHMREAVMYALEHGEFDIQRTIWPGLYVSFYQNNFLLVSPAVSTYKPGEDRFCFLSPFSLHSIGASGTDAVLHQPIIFAAASLPPALKTRILRSGLYVPTLMWLFKKSWTGNLHDPSAHEPAYTLPEEAGKEHQGPAPFLERFVTAAHDLKHIPPVARLRVVKAEIVHDENAPHANKPFMADAGFGYFAALRRGEILELTIDLRQSWTDSLPFTGFETVKLRGEGDVRFLNDGHSMVKIAVPWTPAEDVFNYRTDFALFVKDGTYESAPAYVSVRHLQEKEWKWYGAARVQKE